MSRRAPGIAIFVSIAEPADEPNVAPHTTGLFVGAAALLTLASTFCLGVRGRWSLRRQRPC